MPIPYSAASDALDEYRRKREEREMREALIADGEKLRGLTGADHGPEFWDTCASCGGEGSNEISRPQHDDPFYCEVEQCRACNGVGLIQSV